MIPTKALEYYYCLSKQELAHNKFKGYFRRNLFHFIKAMDDLEVSINQGKVINYEEVMNYEHTRSSQDSCD